MREAADLAMVSPQLGIQNFARYSQVGFWWSVKNRPASAGDVSLGPWVREDPLRSEWLPIPVLYLEILWTVELLWAGSP